MLIVQAAGGLGNQMQQYALYRKLELMGRDVRLDLTWFRENDRPFELTAFPNVRFTECSAEEREWMLDRSPLRRALDRIAPAKSTVFNESAMYHPEVFEFTDKYLSGYWHCRRYTEDISATLRNEFAFAPHADKDRESFLELLMQEMEVMPSVSVHIRRGDYVDVPENARLFGGIATEDYYRSAMAYFLSENPDTRFYYFTNDMEYVKERYNNDENFVFVTGNTGKDSIQDMRLMARCHGNICANSTFSVWGARLNVHDDARRVRPLKMKNGQDVLPERMQGYWPGWVLIDHEGKRLP